MKNQIISLLCGMMFCAISAQNEARNHQKVFKKIIKTTEQHICNPAFLETQDWADFKSQIEALSMQEISDLDFARIFNRASGHQMHCLFHTITLNIQEIPM